jgi:C4-dicarboxylate-specific signal transduction histidine kinase
MVKPASARMETSVFRPLRIATFAFLALLVLGLVVSAGLSVREQQRLRAAQAQLERLQRFEEAEVLVERRLTIIGHELEDDPEGRQFVMQEIDELIELATDPETPPRLRELRLRVQRVHNGSVEFVQTIVEFNDVAATEQQRSAAVLAGLQEESATQVRLELAAPLAILAVGILLFPVARRRIIKPLDAFGRQLARLADGQFVPAPVDERVDPFLLPLHRQFNQLARRLQELEAAHRAHEASLHATVRAATEQLLDQQRSLARAERLAATGELAASVAHELRNPLAGLQMTLSNLRAELHDAELTERVDLMIHEVGRLTRLLNELLDAARHAPEPARPLRLAELVDEMLALIRYQLTAAVRLESGVDPALTCRMPVDRLRQALLNLILNAAGALGERGGVIRIDAAAEGGLLRIAVTDDGPGFPPELLDGGIRPFFSTRERGTGLGLAMVRRFARDLGGTLELTNVEPHGARVTLVLPTDIELA